jgi:DNA-binding response OmpR family regulator
MKNMKSVLLVFDDSKELEFMQTNLMENGFQVYTAINLDEALLLALTNIPNLIVVNGNYDESLFQQFAKQLKTESLKKVSLLNLMELGDYLKSNSKTYFVVKLMRPKLLLSLIRSLMHHEKINWLPSFR